MAKQKADDSKKTPAGQRRTGHLRTVSAPAPRTKGDDGTQAGQTATGFESEEQPAAGGNKSADGGFDAGVKGGADVKRLDSVVEIGEEE